MKKGYKIQWQSIDSSYKILGFCEKKNQKQNDNILKNCKKNNSNCSNALKAGFMQLLAKLVSVVVTSTQ